jgi:adenylate kinase family enzyme
MTERDYPLGRRISVRGNTGSGKSTLARALGEALGLTVIELDAINWQRPGWDEISKEEFRAQVSDAIAAAPDGWVIEGNYSAVADIYLAQVDTLIWLNLPWRVSFYRMVTRTLGRARKNELLWGAQHESVRTQLFDPKNSLWWWGIKHHRAGVRNHRRILESLPHVPNYELRTKEDVAALLEAAREQGIVSS